MKINDLEFISFLHQPRSTREIAGHFACTTRTVYRHLAVACDRWEIKKTCMANSGWRYQTSAKVPHAKTNDALVVIALAEYAKLLSSKGAQFEATLINRLIEVCTAAWPQAHHQQFARRRAALDEAGLTGAFFETNIDLGPAKLAVLSNQPVQIRLTSKPSVIVKKLRRYMPECGALELADGSIIATKDVQSMVAPALLENLN